MLVILPVVSIAHTIIYFKVYFATDNIMRPWHLSYMLTNILLILKFFMISQMFLPVVRDNMINNFDRDPWQDHLDAILHFIK